MLLIDTQVHSENTCRALVVVGMADEHAIAVGDDVQVVVGAADAELLRERLAIVDTDGIGAVYSFGVAGGLNPDLAAGDLLVSSTVVVQGGAEEDMEPWLADRILLGAILNRAGESGSVNTRAGVFLGTDTEARENSRDELHDYRESYGAEIVDNESHIAAEFASEHRLPFVAVRAVSDFVDNALPPAALLPLDEDGSPDGMAIVKSLISKPWQIPALIRTALDYKRALDSLRAYRREIGFVSPAGCP